MADSRVVDSPVTTETNQPLSTPVNSTAPSPADTPLTTKTNEPLSTTVNTTVPSPVDAPVTTEANEPPSTPVKAAAPSPQQTPIVHKGTTQVHSMDHFLANEAYQRIAFETEGHYLVGMPPDKFLEVFLPWNDDTPDDYKQKAPSRKRKKDLKSVPSGDNEQEKAMYPRFVEALNRLVGDRTRGSKVAPRLLFAHFNNPDVMCNSMNVDVSAYWSDEFRNTDGSVMDACTFSLQQTHVEFKPDLTYDAFRHEKDEGPKTVYPAAKRAGTTNKAKLATSGVADESIAEKPEATPEQALAEGLVTKTTGDAKPQVAEDNVSSPSLIADVEADTQAGIHVRGQIAAYASLAMSMSFRKHFFSMLILGEYARFIRWDRRGAVVTTRFDYVRRPELIFNLYLRFGQLSPAQRGLDTRATRLDLRREKLPEKVAHHFDLYYQQSWYDGATFGHHPGPSAKPQAPAATLPFYRLVVEDPILEEEQTFFVPAPIFRQSYLTPFARSTRRSLAFLDHPTEGKMCFMKDSWQEVSSRTPPEADIYRKLHAAGVQHIASMRLGGNVEGLETETQKWFNKLAHSGKFKKLGIMVCHRLLLDTVARDLSTFTWSKVLLSCIADAVDAAQQAYKAGVLHRDISAGNVMIVRNKKTGEWRGLLIDWEMSLLLEKVDQKNDMRTGRTGTWAFISAKLLRSTPFNPVKHTLADDMESFFWVLAYQILRYTKHDKDPHDLYMALQHLFSDARPIQGGVIGGSQKILALLACSQSLVEVGLSRLQVSALNMVFQELAVVFASRYSNGPASQDGKSGDRDIGNPDDKWLSTVLRQMAANMAPLGVTITALNSPTNDSNPPKDLDSWRSATIREHPTEYHEMKFFRKEFDSSAAREKQLLAVQDSLINHLDGLSRSASKRQRDDSEDQDQTEQSAPAKKSKPTS